MRRGRSRFFISKERACGRATRSRTGGESRARGLPLANDPPHRTNGGVADAPDGVPLESHLLSTTWTDATPFVSVRRETEVRGTRCETRVARGRWDPFALPRLRVFLPGRSSYRFVGPIVISTGHGGPRTARAVACLFWPGREDIEGIPDQPIRRRSGCIAYSGRPQGRFAPHWLSNAGMMGRSVCVCGDTHLGRGAEPGWALRSAGSTRSMVLIDRLDAFRWLAAVALEHTRNRPRLAIHTSSGHSRRTAS